MTASPAYPPPPSCKGVYPFRLGTTSFIFPDDYIPNVRVLAPCFDEIELLMFESRRPDSLPSKETVEALGRLSAETDTGYNVHLPTDVSLAAADGEERGWAADVLGRFIAATAPLSPSAYALHLPYEGYSADPEGVDQWRKAAARGIEALLGTGVRSDRLAVETLDYPFVWAAPLIEDYGLSVCMDIGHLILYGVDPLGFFERFRKKISLIHLHGVRFAGGDKSAGQDHVGLDEMAPNHFPSIMEILSAFEGVVSLEVFSYRHLVPSLRVLEDQWQRCREGNRK
ncbi:cobamide remodeling phosphodiesterase CbiR [Desulfococcus sp.]|uniref:cobamide remodeling phosphodiesterase CbiR n=1 Tax=Desulfococcus sp. TaxID=2025834 RepID=UPI003593B7C1